MIRLLRPAGLVLILMGCADIPEHPLEHDELVELARERLTGLEPGRELDWPRARLLLEDRHPELDRLKVEAEGLARQADIASPLSNPELTLGGIDGHKLSDNADNSLGSVLGLGWSIPLGPRLARRDDVKKSRAARAWLELELRRRELVLDTHRAWVDWTFVRAHVSRLEHLNTAWRTASRLATDAAQTGLLGADIRLDVGAEQEDFISRLAAARKALIRAESILCQRLGLRPEQLRGLQAPQPPRPASPPVRLPSRLLENDPDLARLRADYDLAEAQLRLELARRIPDLNIGAEAEKEAGEDSVFLGLSLGIELPVFDRNQEAITEAHAAREVLRARYVELAMQRLVELDELEHRLHLGVDDLGRRERWARAARSDGAAVARRLHAAGIIGDIELARSLVRSLDADLGEMQSLREHWDGIINMYRMTGVTP